MIPIKYNLRSLFVRRTSSLATVIGVGLVVFVLAAALMLSAGVKKTLTSSGAPDVAMVLRKGSDAELGSNVEDVAVSLIKAQPGIVEHNGQPLAVGEVVVVMAMNKLGTSGVANVQVRGVSEGSLALRPQLKIIEGRAPKSGTDEVMVGRRIRGRFEGLEIGGRFDLRKNRPMTVVGVFAAEGTSHESEIWCDFDTLRAAFAREGSVSAVRVKMDSPSRFEGLRAAIEQDKRMGLQVMREKEYYEKISEGTSLFVTALGATIAVFFSLGAMIGAMITMYAAVSNRKREIGTLRALGFSRRQVLLAFLLESLALSLVGGLVGTLGALALGNVQISMMNFQSWSEMVFTFQPTLDTILIALGFSLGMGLLGGMLPAFTAARLSPLEAIKD
jgi:putative ABC transport system permease protein